MSSFPSRYVLALVLYTENRHLMLERLTDSSLEVVSVSVSVHDKTGHLNHDLGAWNELMGATSPLPWKASHKRALRSLSCR